MDLILPKYHLVYVDESDFYFIRRTLFLPKITNSTLFSLFY